MKLLITGLPADVQEDALREAMEKMGPVLNVVIYREGSANNVWATVEMTISDEQAFQITTRITDIWHGGQFVNARIMLH